MKFDEVLKILYSNILDQYFELSIDNIFCTKKNTIYGQTESKNIFKV